MRQRVISVSSTDESVDSLPDSEPCGLNRLKRKLLISDDDDEEAGPSKKTVKVKSNEFLSIFHRFFWKNLY